MKVAIVYSTHYGLSTEAAHILQEELNTPSDIIQFDLDTNIEDLDSYDAYILGGSIRMGIFNQEFMKWMKEKSADLATKPLGLFIAYGYEDNLKNYLKAVFPSEIRKKALFIAHLGGRFNKPEQYNFYDRALIKLMKSQLQKKNNELPHPNFEPLTTLARVIDDSLQKG